MLDRHGEPIDIGDWVVCSISPGPPELSIIIGEMSYRDNVACVATDQFTGMPVNTGHLTLVGRTDDIDKCMALRARYQRLMPGAFKSGSR